MQPFLNNFIIVYFDDILVYNKICDDHLLHLRILFEILHKHKLHINLSKCSFMSTDIAFLGFYINQFGITVDPSKISAIQNWPTPTSVRDIQCFLGLASLYRKFIKLFSTLAAPLTECLKNGKFFWDTDQASSFENLKNKLSNTPVLGLPDFSQPFEVAIDASEVGIGAVLSQKGHPLEYFSEKLTPLRQKWCTYEQELYALIRALKQWEHHLIGREFMLKFRNTSHPQTDTNGGH